MTGACSIVFDKERVFIAFAYFKKRYLTFLEELEIPLSATQDDILIFLRENLETLGKKISEIEEKYSFEVGRIFLGLPFGFSSEKVVEETILLKRKKQITPTDISFARKQLEDKFLDWDDFCLHNIVLNYRVSSSDYETAPLGVWAKKIGINSLLIWIKDKIYKEAVDICDSLGKDFGGFIDYHIGVFSSAFIRRKNSQIVIDIGYDRTSYVISEKGRIVFGDEVDFNLKKLIRQLANRFVLDFNLAQEVFARYASFKEIPYFKEVTVKRNDAYMKLSTHSLNSFIKEYLREEFVPMVLKIGEGLKSDDFEISFIGKLNKKEGFYSFLKDYVPYTTKSPLQKSTLSSSYGCLRYGVNRFLEKDHQANESFLQRILRIYREYF